MIDLNRFESVCDYFKSLQFFVLDTHMMNQVWKFLSAFFSVQPISAPARPLSRHYFRRHMYGKIVLAPVPSKPVKIPKSSHFPAKFPSNWQNLEFQLLFYAVIHWIFTVLVIFFAGTPLFKLGCLRLTALPRGFKKCKQNTNLAFFDKFFRLWSCKPLRKWQFKKSVVSRSRLRVEGHYSKNLWSKNSPNRKESRNSPPSLSSTQFGN